MSRERQFGVPSNSAVRRISALAVGALLLAVAGLTGSVPASGVVKAHASGAGNSCTTSSRAGHDGPTPFAGVCDYLDGRDGVVQAALFDEKAGRAYLLSNGDNPQYTASIVKVDILAKWLHHLQRQGTEIPGQIHYSIQYLLQRMIDNSDNAAATSLFYFGGGCDALSRFNKLIPLEETKVGCETPNYYGWGNTTTTAADQIALMKVFAYGKPKHVLGPDARSYGRQLMEGVEPDQRFGISCGPWGTSCSAPNYAQPVPGVTVALKNGWKTLPTCSQPIDQCPWQVNSTGWVEGQGRNYVLSVLTTHDPVGSGGVDGFNYGIDTIQNVSERVWDNLAPAPVAPTSAPRSSDLRSFQSPSKNIGCVMVRGGLGHGVRCDIRQHSWHAPPKPPSCDVDWGNGLEVGRHHRAHFVCAGDTVLGQGPVLDYGKSIRFGGFKCKSKRSGVRCVNRSTDHGFKLSRQKAKRF